jgi:hypothetical protein
LSKGAGACLTIDEFWNNSADSIEAGDVVVLNEDQSATTNRHYDKPISCVRLCDSVYDHKVVGVKVFEDLAHSGKGTYEKILEEDQFFNSIKDDYTIEELKDMIDDEIDAVAPIVNQDSSIQEHFKDKFLNKQKEKQKGNKEILNYLAKDVKTDDEKKRYLMKHIPVIAEMKGHHGYSQKIVSNFFCEERKKWDIEKCAVTKPNRRFVVGVLGQYGKCKVDSDIAPIQVGDLLTTSPTKQTSTLQNQIQFLTWTMKKNLTIKR